jgi:hypothetical protein
MAKEATRKETKAHVTDPPEPTPFERMTELTRRLLGVQKAEVVVPAKRKTRQ